MFVWINFVSFLLSHTLSVCEMITTKLSQLYATTMRNYILLSVSPRNSDLRVCVWTSTRVDFREFVCWMLFGVDQIRHIRTILYIHKYAEAYTERANGIGCNELRWMLPEYIFGASRGRRRCRRRRTTTMTIRWHRSLAIRWVGVWVSLARVGGIYSYYNNTRSCTQRTHSQPFEF